MKLHGYFRSSASFRVRIALNLKGLDYDIVPVNLLKGEQKSDAYRARNPQGLVPTVELDDGTLLTQSLAIMEYLDSLAPDPRMVPTEPLARARVTAMAHIVASEIQPLLNLRILKYLKGPLGQDDDGVAKWYREWLNSGFAALEARIAEFGGDYCFGDSPTIVDACLVPQVWNARRFECDLTHFPKIVEIDARLRALPAVDAAMPENQPDAV